MFSSAHFLIVYFIILLSADIYSVTIQSCEKYTGNVCHRYEKNGVPKLYQIPKGKTQAQIDTEIINATHEHPLKYIACKQYITNLVCTTTLLPCQGNKQICQGCCKAAKESICFKGMVKDSNIYKWYHDTLLCGESSNGNCRHLEEQKGNDRIKEESCKMESEIQQKDRTMHVSLISQNTQSPKINQELLSKCLPFFLKSDLICYRKKRKVNSIVKGKIKDLPNLVIDNIADRTINGYCYSPLTKTRVMPIASLSNYEPALNLNFKDSQVIFIQKENENPFIGIIGTSNICLDIGNFHYNILRDEGKLHQNEESLKGIYKGISTSQVQWKWIDQAENNLDVTNINVKDFMLRMGYPVSLNLSRPTQIIGWNQKSTYKLFIDNNASFLTPLNGINSQYLFGNIRTEILITEHKKHKWKSTAYYFVISEDITLWRTLKMILNGRQFEKLKLFLDLESLDNYFKFSKAEYFLKGRSDGLQVPLSERFRKMKSLIDQHAKDLIVIKMIGKFVLPEQAKLLWLEPTNFLLKYKLSDKNKDEFHFELQPRYSKKDCARKKNQDWHSFQKILQIIDRQQESLGNKKIIRSEKITHCIVCCNYNVFTLKSITINKFKMDLTVTATITLVVVNRNVELTFQVEDYNLELLIATNDIILKNK